ncbi:MAG TPA: hypothetical protein VFV68_10865, partial [Agriterribacter sp.]|nr:hypothetical protein [Agriterribacter sp.]
MLAQLMDSNWIPLVCLLVLAVTVTAGIWMSRKLQVAESPDWKSRSLVSAIISFFSLLLAFTLSSSSDANKKRIVF